MSETADKSRDARYVKTIFTFNFFMLENQTMYIHKRVTAWARLSLCATMIALSGACSRAPETTVSSAADSSATNAANRVRATNFPVVNAFMQVNGEAIDRALVLSYASERGFDVNDPAQLKNAADKVAELVAVTQAGQADAYSKTPEYALAQLKLAASVYVSHLASTPPFSDRDVKAHFDKQIAATGGLQLNMQQIVSNDVLTAQTVQAALASGKSFAAVMSELRGTPGVREAKDLGWVTVLNLLEPLRAPALALGTAGFSKEPIAIGGAQYFLNIIESRALTAPQFSEVADGMRKAMEASRADQRIEEINARSKVEIL
jgi:hypothetical protein